MTRMHYHELIIFQNNTDVWGEKLAGKWIAKRGKTRQLCLGAIRLSILVNLSISATIKLCILAVFSQSSFVPSFCPAS